MLDVFRILYRLFFIQSTDCNVFCTPGLSYPTSILQTRIWILPFFFKVLRRISPNNGGGGGKLFPTCFWRKLSKSGKLGFVYSHYMQDPSRSLHHPVMRTVHNLDLNNNTSHQGLKNVLVCFQPDWVWHEFPQIVYLFVWKDLNWSHGQRCA